MGGFHIRLALLALAVAHGFCLADVELITLEPVRELRVGGILLGSALPSGTAIRISQTGCQWAYSDLFMRNFRGRRQVRNYEFWGEPAEDLLNYRADEPKPRVLLDLYSREAADIHFNLREDILWWTGEIVYRFSFGFPVKSCWLQSLEGRQTTIGDWEWQKVGRAVKIFASRDGTGWVQVWASQQGRGGVTPVSAEVPAEALGSTDLYLKFWGQNNNVIYDLFLSGELQVPPETLALLLARRRNVSAEPSPEAVVAGADGERVGHASPPPKVSRAVVSRTGESLSITWPGQTRLVFDLRDGHLAGWREMWVCGKPIVAPFHGGNRWALESVSKGPGGIEAPTDWAAYLAEREAAGGKWPSRGAVQLERDDLSTTRLGDVRAEGDAVKAVFEVASPHVSRMEWVLRPVSASAIGWPGEAGKARGFSWAVRLAGRNGWQPVRLSLSYPVYFTSGNWLISQGWSHTEQVQLSYLSQAAPLFPWSSWYYGYHQPLAFLGTRAGCFVEAFAEPVAAETDFYQELAWLRRRITMPVGSDGGCPELLFLLDARPVKSIQQASDRYFEICDAQAKALMRSFFPDPDFPADPLPIAWTYQAGSALSPVREGRAARTDYLDRLAAAMPALARLGVGETFISGAIESDAEHPESEYLLGGHCFGSICAPWLLRVSPGLGGEEALARLCAAAHGVGIRVIVWMTPAHYSNSSPILRQHPDWIAWRPDGTPETFGYQDITGVSLRTPAFDYAVESYRRLRATGLDGFWMDSYCTFGLLTDYAHGHPMPQLDRTLALQAELWRMGYRRLQIEACGPSGISSGGHGSPQALDELRRQPEGAYRFVCFDVPPHDYDFETYFRCLANKCCLSFLPPGELVEAVEQGRLRPDSERLAAVNRAYMQALPLMKRRQLLGDKGVLWHSPRGQVLWAYRSFEYPLPAKKKATDLLTGREVATKAVLRAQPWHVYSIVPAHPS